MFVPRFYPESASFTNHPACFEAYPCEFSVNDGLPKRCRQSDNLGRCNARSRKRRSNRPWRMTRPPGPDKRRCPNEVFPGEREGMRTARSRRTRWPSDTSISGSGDHGPKCDFGSCRIQRDSGFRSPTLRSQKSRSTYRIGLPDQPPSVNRAPEYGFPIIFVRPVSREPFRDRLRAMLVWSWVRSGR